MKLKSPKQAIEIPCLYQTEVVVMITFTQLNCNVVRIIEILSSVPDVLDWLYIYLTVTELACYGIALSELSVTFKSFQLDVMRRFSFIALTTTMFLIYTN